MRRAHYLLAVLDASEKIEQAFVVHCSCAESYRRIGHAILKACRSRVTSTETSRNSPRSLPSREQRIPTPSPPTSSANDSARQLGNKSWRTVAKTTSSPSDPSPSLTRRPTRTRRIARQRGIRVAWDKKTTQQLREEPTTRINNSDLMHQQTLATVSLRRTATTSRTGRRSL